MIACPTVRKATIRRHYDWTTLFYRLLWGPHIHHGYWDGSESVRVAQQQLTTRLARMAGIVPGSRVLDIGCGMGGSAIHLARELDCDVTGVTISRFQREWARLAARWHGQAARTTFRRDDADRVPFDAAAFDVVWSIECTEHLFDKPGFFRRAASWLRPGGSLAICAWLAGEDAASRRESEQQVRDVCEGFFCPSLGTAGDYRRWFDQAGLQLVGDHDWTVHIERTWEICRRRVAWAPVRLLAHLLGQHTVLFLDRFDTILQAYRSGAMRYGCLVAHKPETQGCEDSSRQS